MTSSRRGSARPWRGSTSPKNLSDRLEYRAEDINALKLPRARYDIVFFHGSLHHVRQIERVLTEVRQSLKPGGLIYLDEYMGPSRSEWSDEEWSFARSAFRGFDPGQVARFG